MFVQVVYDRSDNILEMTLKVMVSIGKQCQGVVGDCIGIQSSIINRDDLPKKRGR